MTFSPVDGSEEMGHGLLAVGSLDRAHAWAVDVLVDRTAEFSGVRLAVVPGYPEVSRVLELRLKLLRAPQEYAVRPTPPSPGSNYDSRNRAGVVVGQSSPEHRPASGDDAHGADAREPSNGDDEPTNRHAGTRERGQSQHDAGADPLVDRRMGIEERPDLRQERARVEAWVGHSPTASRPLPRLGLGVRSRC